MGDDITGLALQVDPKLLNDIKELDERIKSIEKHSKQGAEIFNKWFGAATATNIGNVADMLERVQKAVKEIAKTDVSKLSSLGNVTTSLNGAAAAAENVSRLAQSMSQLSDKSNALPTTKIAEMGTNIQQAFPYESGKNIDQLTTAIANINKVLVDSKGGVASRVDEQYLVNLRERYKQELAILNLSDRKKTLDKDQSGALSSANKLTNERIRLEQKILDIQTKLGVEQAKNKARVITTDEQALINQYSQRLQEITDKLNRMKAFYPEIVAQAQKAFDTKSLDGLIRSYDKLAVAQEKADKKQEKTDTTNRNQAESKLNSLYNERLTIVREIDKLTNKETLNRAKGKTELLSPKEQQYAEKLHAELNRVDASINRIGKSYRALQIVAEKAYKIDELKQTIQLENQLADAIGRVQAQQRATQSSGLSQQTADIRAHQKEYRDVLAQIEKVNAALKKYNDYLSSTGRTTSGTSAAANAKSQLLADQQALNQQKADLERRYGADIAQIRIQYERKANMQALSEYERSERERVAAGQRHAQRLLRVYEQLAERRKRIEADAAIQPQNAMANAQTALLKGSLNDLTKAYKNLRTAMDNTTPNTPQWVQMNNVYKQVGERINQIRRDMGELQGSQRKLMDTSGQLGRMLAGIFSVSAIQGYINKLVEVRAQFELQQTALRAILQDKDEADRVFAQVQQLALQSPFSIMEMTTFTKQLAAYRIESEKLVDTTKMLADVSAGLGVEMGRLILAYGQVKAANYLRACLGFDTPVKMFDGTFKKVQDVIVGDVLMGDDEQPRHVSNLYQGTQMMYRVKYDGGVFRCNEHHILTVYDALNERIEDVFVFDYVKEPHRYQGIKRVNGKYETFPMKVEKDIVDTYYGFSIDGNHRFIIQDNIVTHNTEVRQFTEAGLNIAGELAQYFSELKGEMVSVGDVMDMITKRMVRFEDVEEVFHRVTSAGGLFYDMQKKQADTLWGQMQRIKDAMDLMFNEIGKSNQGAISVVLSTIRLLINNWKAVANIIYGVSAAFGAYAIKVTLAAIANNAFNASQTGIVGTIAKVRNALMAFGKSLMSNPWLLIIGATTAATLAIIDHIKQVKATKKVYEDLAIGFVNEQKNINALADKIKQSNEKVAKSQADLSNAKKGTEQYSDAVAANKEALTEQYRAMEELRSKFPELAADVENAKDKTEALNKAVTQLNAISSGASIIATIIGQDTDLKGSFEKVSQEQDKYNASLAKTEAAYNTLMAKAQILYDLAQKQGNITAEEEAKYKALFKIRDSQLSIEEKLVQTINSQSLGFQGLKKEAENFKDNFSETFGQGFFKVGRSYRKAMETAEKSANVALKAILTQAGVTSVEAFKSLPEEAQKSAFKAGEHVIKELGLSLDEVQRDILRRQIEIPIGFRFEFDPKEQKLSYLQEKINSYINQHPEVNIAPISATEDTDNYFKSLKSNYEQDIKDREQYQKATVQLDKNKTNEQMANEKKVQAEARKTMLLTFGIDPDQKKGRGRTEDKELKRWQEIKKAIEEANKSYEKYRKYYTEDEAAQKIREQYGAAFKEMGIELDQFYKDGKYDTEALIKALGVLKSQIANQIGGDSSRKKFWDELIRSLESEVVELEIKAKEESIEKLKKQISDLFDNYELTKTFDSLGFGVEFTYLVGGQPVTLDDIKKQLQDLSALGTKEAEEQIKILKDAQKKLEETEHKEALERLKSYNKYLVKGYGDAGKVQIKYLDQIRRMYADFAKYEDKLKIKLTDPTTSKEDAERIQSLLDSLPAQAKDAAKGMRAEMEKELAKISYDKLLNSPLFSEMFQDLGALTNKTLNMMIAKIRQLRAENKNLTLSQIRTLSQYEEKLTNAKFDNSPFKETFKAIKDAYDLLRKGITPKSANEALANAQLELSNLEQQIDGYNLIIGLKEKGYEFDKGNLKLGDDTVHLKLEQVSLASKSVNVLRQERDTLEEAKEAQEGVVEVATGNVQVFKIAQNATEKLANTLQALGQLAKQAIGVITDGMAVFGVQLSDADQAWVDFAGNFIESALKMAGQIIALGEAVNSAMGIIGIISTALTIVASLFQTILKAHDAKIDAKIEKLKNKVDDLSRSYDRLTEAVSNAYMAMSAMSGHKEAIRTQKLIISQYQQMIELEKSKKKSNTDKIREYQQAIEDARQALKEFEDDYAQKWGGFGSYNDARYSAAESFMSAWLDAFNEVGDGLDALREQWDEYIDNLIIKQATLRLVGARLNKLFDMVDKAVSEQSAGGELLTKEELEAIQAERDRITSQLNDELKQFLESLGYVGKGENILSDLQKGIQNITEPQAAAIEAYMNSIRFAVFEGNEIKNQILAVLQSQYDTSDSPMLNELKGMHNVLRDIRSDFRKVLKTVPGRGYALQIV